MSIVSDEDSCFEREDFENMLEEEPQHTSADAIEKILRERYGVRLAKATIARLLVGDLCLRDFSEQGIALWADWFLGSPIKPTFTPAHHDVIPPRVLLVTEDAKDTKLIDQLNAFGADVILTGYGDDAQVLSRGLGAPSLEAVKFAATERFDVAWLNIRKIDPLMIVTDWLHQRRIPYVYSNWKLPFVPHTVMANGIFFRCRSLRPMSGR